MVIPLVSLCEGGGSNLVGPPEFNLLEKVNNWDNKVGYPEGSINGYQ